MRLILNIILFLGSLLCIYTAPTFRLWIASIAVSEFCWIFAAVTFLILIWSLFSKKYRQANLTIGVLALAFYLTPIRTAVNIAEKLPTELAANLGGEPIEAEPFELTKMFTSTELLPYETFSYAKQGSEDLTMDFYQSTRAGRRPCIVVVHGGSWCGGNSQQLPELNSELARQGFHVASINYRLAPKHVSPAPIEDIKIAIEYLKDNARDLKIDSANFILLGRSAGAQLALVAAYTLDTPGIRGVVNFYGPTDMIWGYSMPVNKYIMDSKKVLEDFLGGPYDKCPEKYVASSPVEVVGKKSVPTLIIHGENDALVAYEHSQRLVKKLSDNRVRHYLLSLPWATHGCDYTLRGPSGQLTTYAVEYFANQVIKAAQQPDIQIVSSETVEPGAFESWGN
ncbi:MAG TPA: alpha/beta hydrolase [Cyclobacteriaceae bacterium]|nr:alpha/beta hydrolase [Cyclobacteriaceae bacterium]